MKENISDLIVNFYLDKYSTKAPAPIQDAYCQQAITFNHGIGDTAIINNLSYNADGSYSNISIYSHGHHFNSILNYNKYKDKNSFQPDAPTIRTEVLENFNFGPGHLIQTLRRAFGLDEILKPRAPLFTGKIPKKNKIGVHLSTGVSAFELSNIKNSPRQIYPENIDIIKELILENSSEYEFVEFGGESLGLGCTSFCGRNLTESIEELSTCDYFIGLNSGFMNLAASLDIKSIIIVNIPESEDLVLPRLKDLKISDANWLYPQNVHLHQDNSTTLVPRLSKDNILKAINGEIYPFWSNDYLDLIFHKFNS